MDEGVKISKSNMQNVQEMADLQNRNYAPFSFYWQ